VSGRVILQTFVEREVCKIMRRIVQLLVVIIVCNCSMSAFAQEKAAADRLLDGRAQYYTPTASGLKSFQCEATLDWKGMLSRIGGKDIPDDNPILKYLNVVHLSISDQVKGAGLLEWADTEVPPPGKEQNARQMRDGLETTIDGFFQTWNGYINGSMVPPPDKTLTVTKAGAGLHVSGNAGETTFDEDYDENMLLTRALVVNPTMRVVATPTFVRSTDGLLLSAVTSLINQPPSAPQTEVTFRIDYMKVDSFQLPSHLLIDVKNVAMMEFSFSACKAQVEDFGPKPAAK
jgi:hypothetical protein